MVTTYSSLESSGSFVCRGNDPFLCYSISTRKIKEHAWCCKEWYVQKIKPLFLSDENMNSGYCLLSCLNDLALWLIYDGFILNFSAIFFRKCKNCIPVNWPKLHTIIHFLVRIIPLLCWTLEHNMAHPRTK